MQPVHIERVVGMPVINPATGAASRTFHYRGKVDRVEGRVLVDWKSVANPDVFIESHTIGFQAELYALALRHEGIEIDEIQYRLVQRPTIRFCGKDADRDAYEDRCVEWLRDKPGAMIEHEHMLSEERIEQARIWLWSVSKRIIDARRTGMWLTNELACRSYNRQCEYLPLCMARAQGGDWEWLVENSYVKSAVHPELDLDDTDALTYSSGTTMALCEMKYKHRYDMGIRPNRDDDGEALYIGSAFHEGMEGLDKGLESALARIDEWGNSSLAIGEDDIRKHDQRIAAARACVRVAAEKWGLGG